jgi:dihydroflavonol-4-reductase
MATVLLTGVTGFIAKHIALQLLQAGHTVRGTVRNLDRLAEVRSALAPHLEPAALDRLSVVRADLTSDDGWTEAAQGADVLMHTASPFPITEPKNPDDLIRPAVDGTLRALKAAEAAGITRVILTSSVIAVVDDKVAGEQTEDNWLDPKAPGTTSYAVSKLRAEEAAWEFVKSHPQMAMTTVNPALVLGPPLDRHYGSSLQVVERLLRGRDPAVPRFGFGIVDVRDIAAMHLRAMERPETAGRRYIGSAGSMWMEEMAATLKAAYPARRISTRRAPDWLLRVIALWDRDVRTILPRIGKRDLVSSARARAELGIDFIPPAEALRASADGLVKAGV